jgi:hypothetical protein
MRKSAKEERSRALLSLTELLAKKTGFDSENGVNPENNDNLTPFSELTPSLVIRCRSYLYVLFIISPVSGVDPVFRVDPIFGVTHNVKVNPDLSESK